MEIIKIIYGVIFVLFLPGFVMSFVFFDNKKIDIIERIALSFALSIAVIPLAVFYANIIGLKLDLPTVSYIILQVIVLALIVLLIKKYFLKDEKQS